MIFQEGGRWRSEASVSEQEAAVQDILSKLSSEERASLELVLDELKENGSSEIADSCAELEWEEVPLPIEEWLESDYHIGDTGKTLYPVLKKDMIELFNGDYHEVILCLRPETRVPLLDGSSPTIRELANQWEQDKSSFWVYSYINGEVKPTKAILPRQTGVDDYYRVTLNDGSTFVGNARHQMLRRNGEKVMIRDMQPGDSLVPFEGGAFVVESIEKSGRGPVYCMTVPEAGNFAITTGKEGKTTRCGVFSSNTGSIGWG